MTTKRKIENDKFYKVIKNTSKKTFDYGTMTGSDVKLIVKYYTYDKELSNYFPNVIIYSRKSTVIWIEER